MENFSEITFCRVERFRIARYVIISPNPESDVCSYMDGWAKSSGLLDYPGYVPRRIGWDFPTFSEQLDSMGLRGYVSAFIIPADFKPACEGADMGYVEADNYAMITVTDPFSRPFELIPEGYHRVFDYIENHRIGAKEHESRICFEEVRVENNVTYMDIYIPVDKKI